MGGSSDQVTGYKYVTNFLLFIGNPIEKVLGINFDKRGWLTPLIDEMKNPLSVGVVEKPTLYGENEGGVVGQIYAKYGTDNQQVVPFYKDYMDSKELPASAYPFQSYLAFKDFYVGNSGYMKEMLLWPKRIHVRNDGRAQWYDLKAEVQGGVTLEVPSNEPLDIPEGIYITRNLNADGGSVISDPEFGDIRGKIVLFFGGGWSTSIIDNLKPASFISKMIGPLSRWVGSVAIKVNPTGNISITGGTFSHNDEYGWSFYNIDFIGEVFEINLKTNNTHSIYWSYLSLQRFGLPLPQIYVGDINPIHKIREILTDDIAMNKPESSVNDLNFMKAADRIFDEGLGVSWSITEKSCIDAINELCYHIEAGLRANRQTGLYEMVLFRDDWFDEDEIHIISESKIKSMSYEITNADEVINQVNVNFYDRDNIKNSSFSISENGLIQTLNRVNAETVDFPYFMNMRNAEVVANWKLKQLSTGAIKGTFTTGWREARKWNRYDLIRLPWSKRWIGAILVRIMSINLGGPTNNEVSIEFVEVVPSTGMMNTTIVADEVIDKPLPPQTCEYEPFELPYYLAVMALGQRQVDEELAYDSNFGLVGVVAEKPQSNSLYAIMKTHNGVEGREWLRAASIQYSETVDSDQVISKTSTSFTVKNWKKISNVPVGTLIQCGKEWLTGLSEWMVFQGVNPNTGVVSVKRGALDTQPQEWDSNLKLYFCGNDVAYDETEYVSGEEVLVSALTTTPSGVLEQTGSNQVEMKARAIRPYAPANVKINDEYWPGEITGDLILTWVDRNRVQQTGGDILGWFENGVIPENGVTYTVKLIGLDSNTVLNETVGIVGNEVVYQSNILESLNRVELVAVRDNHESMGKFTHTFKTSNAVPDVENKLIGSSFVGNTNLGGLTISPHQSTTLGDELVLVLIHRASSPDAFPINPGWTQIFEYNAPSGEQTSSAMKATVWIKTVIDSVAETVNYNPDYLTASLHSFRNAAISVVKSTEITELNVTKDQDSALLVVVAANGYSDTGSSPQLRNICNYTGRSVIPFDPSIFYTQQVHHITQGIKLTNVGVSIIEHSGKLATYSRISIILEIN